MKRFMKAGTSRDFACANCPYEVSFVTDRLSRWRQPPSDADRCEDFIVLLVHQGLSQHGSVCGSTSQCHVNGQQRTTETGPHSCQGRLNLTEPRLLCKHVPSPSRFGPARFFRRPVWGMCSAPKLIEWLMANSAMLLRQGLQHPEQIWWDCELRNCRNIRQSQQVAMRPDSMNVFLN